MSPPSEEDISETPRPSSGGPLLAAAAAAVGDSSAWACVTEVSGRLALLPFDDYIFSLYVSRERLVIGTVYGRVLLYTFPSKSQLTGGSFQLFQAHSEDAIRSVYLDRTHVYGIVGNHACLEFEYNGSGRDSAVRFDRRISPQIKYVLQDKKRCLIPSLGVTTVYDFESKQSYLSPLRLPDSDVVPLDFRDDLLISYIHPSESAAPALKVLKLPLSIEEPKWGTTVDCIFHQELPRSVTGLTKAAFWGADKIAFVTNGVHMYVFDIESGNRLAHWKTGRNEIVLLDASNEHRLITVDVQARLRVWKLSTPLQSIHEQKLPSCFNLNQVYQSAQKEHVFFYSADSELCFVTLTCF